MYVQLKRSSIVLKPNHKEPVTILFKGAVTDDPLISI